MTMRLRACALVSGLSALALFPCCSDGSSQRPETLDSFEVTVPDTVMAGIPFTITVNAVGSRGANPLASFAGSVRLSVSSGGLTPGLLELTGGQGSADCVLSGGEGERMLTASAEDRSGSALLSVSLLTTLPGEPGDMASEQIPNLLYHPDLGHYSGDHPELPGVALSFNSLTLQFVLGTTVAEANEVIGPLDARIVAGHKGLGTRFPGILTIRIPTTTHQQMETALEQLRADPRVLRAVQDTLLFADRIPGNNGGTPADWTWQRGAPQGANWNLEHIRAPQMWNLNDHLSKHNRKAKVLVLDTGFLNTHEDVVYDNWSPGVTDMHGTFVAGVLGAGFDDGGIDGVLPFADIKAFGFRAAVSGSNNAYANAAASFQQVVHRLPGLISTHRDIRVINISMGYNWSKYATVIDLNSNPRAQAVARRQGAILASALARAGHVGALPLIVASAGNDSYGHAGTLSEQPAKYNSPIANAALEHGANCILVAEALESNPGIPGGVLRWTISNVGGTVSAPGAAIWSTHDNPAYAALSGSSYATPHVAGLAGYLLALDPSLTCDELRQLIIDNARNIIDASPGIDAWNSSVDIDRIQGGNSILRALCDIDDGTVDGNRRVDPLTGDDDTDEDADGDGGPGDGSVDMSDFRRWRDWLAQSEGGELDGSEDHPKKDLNGDQTVGTPEEENVYPRGDFNGDGILDAETAGRMQGAIGADVTDLQVLQTVFDDPDYEAGDLDDLVRSIDVEVDATRFFASPAPSPNLTFRVRSAESGDLLEERTHTVSKPTSLVTVPHVSAGYHITLELSTTALEQDQREVILQYDVAEDVLIEVIASLQLNPKSTFLHTCDDNAAYAPALLLSAYGILPGDQLLLESSGNINHGAGLTGDRMIGVFSSNNVLLADAARHRVPGAISAGTPWETEPTWNCGREPTDIPEDFTINDVAVITVPPGAHYLFVAKHDSGYWDNSDQDGDWRFVMAVIRSPD